MCSPDKLPCRHEPGYQPPRQRSFWLNPLILFLSFFHIPYWVMGVLGRARSDGFNLKPGFEPNYPYARIRKTPDYLTNIFSAFHMPVYIACCVYYSITFMLQVLLRPEKVCANKFLSDEEFCKVVESSLYTTMLRKQAHPDPKTGATIYHLGGEPEIPDIVKSGYALPGLHVASYYIQFSIPARATGASRLRLDWIRLNDATTFTPDDHPLAWKWAKVFAMNAIKTYVVYFYHSQIHFPADTLNAFVRSTLPEEHVVRQLLTPHMDHQLEISDCVLDGGMSICEPEKWWVPYAALYLSRENIGRIWSRHSLPKKEFFVQKYQFSEDFVYGRWLKAYHGVVDAYVRKVMSHVDAHDPHIKLLVERLSSVIPDFPKLEGNDITPLADYLSNFVFGCSVWHSGDHYSMQDLCSNTAWPHRLRVPPPASPHAAPAYDGVRSACSLFDWYRHYMADAVIVRFTPNPLRDTTLLASDYPFPPNNKTLRTYVEEFKSALVKTEEKLAQRGENIIPLQEVLRSIEF